MTKYRTSVSLISGILVSGICLPFSEGQAATTNQWTNSVSGLWRVDTNWSAATLPSTGFDFILITNAGTKTVTMDGATPAANLSVRSLQIGAPVGDTNTLLITDVPGAAPLTTSKAFLVHRGGVLIVTNSTLDIGDTFDITAGNMIFESGTIDSTPAFVNIRMGRANGALARMTQNGGNLLCYGLHVGDGLNSEGYFRLKGGVFNSLGVVSMGELLGSTGTVEVVSGQYIATNDLTKVGNLGPGLFLQSGGTSSFAYLSIADNLPGTMNLSGGQLTVVPRTTNDWFRIGNFETGIFNMSGGLAVVRSEFHVADGLSAIGIANITGGQFFATNEICAIGRYGFGTMTVTNATVVMTNVSVGRHDSADGTLNIQSGGAVHCLDALSVGRFLNGTGHVAVVGGLLSITNDAIWVGREGVGDLTVSSGTVRARGLWVGFSENGATSPWGSVLVSGGNTILSSNLLIGSSGISTGMVTISGGNLTITNVSGTGFMDVVSGTAALAGGTLTVDNLNLGNPAGTFSFNSGTLQSKGMIVANGAPFTVGDGVHAALLRLDGGLYSFANGLVISPNATVSGCGTIVGSIINNGTLSTNCGVNIAITQIVKTGTVATVSFTTASGSNHILEYKTNVSGASWTPILPGVTGNGSVMFKQDPTATNSSRFYRIHLQ